MYDVYKKYMASIKSHQKFIIYACLKLTQIKQPMQSWWVMSSLHLWSFYEYYFKYNNKYSNINNVFQQHAFINMRIVASICVNITDYRNT